MKRCFEVVALAALAMMVSASSLQAAGSEPAPQPEQVKTPEEEAIEHYNRGLALAKKAEKTAEKAAAASGGEAAKLEKKLAKQWAAAVREQQSAVRKDPSLFQAHSSLGYALRKTGNYDESLAAYDRALAIEPSYGEAIEYRAQAYLGLGRLDDAKKAYMRLFAGDRGLADQLMEAMTSWLAARQSDPGNVSADELASFSEWLDQRKQVSAQTSELALDTAPRRW